MVNVTHSGLSKFLCYVVLEFKMMGLDLVSMVSWMGPSGNGQWNWTWHQWSIRLDIASLHQTSDCSPSKVNTILNPIKTGFKNVTPISIPLEQQAGGKRAMILLGLRVQNQGSRVSE